VTEAKAHNKARLIVVDPRFTRTASVADYYAPIRTGTDIAFMGGLINYLLTEDKIQHEYVRNYTDVSFIVKAGFASKTALQRLRRGQAQLHRQVRLGLRAGRGRLRQGRPDPAGPALRLSTDEAALQPLQHRSGEPDLRHAGRGDAERSGKKSPRARRARP
jgi:anaerobic selenocysteine-containing dehydrogenase